MSSDRFAAGARIGDYCLDRELANDANAIVYLATHVLLSRRAHLKVARGISRSAAVRLLREACLLEALSHPGIPRVHECGMLPDRRPWASIERTEGVTLEELGGDGPLSLCDAVVALRDVADILRHAHERGVVHRRLTAGAIRRTQRPGAGHMLCDWAEACAIDTEAEVAADPRDDVGALGAIVYRALTGRPPEPAVSVAVHCPAAPVELVALVDQMRAKPVARPVADEIYQRAVWLCDALEVRRFERSHPMPIQRRGSQGGFSESDDGRDSFTNRVGRA